MALTSNIVRTAVSEDGTLSTFQDQTVYGGANPDRAEVAVYFTAYKVDVDQVETALVVSAFDPETATEFTVTNDVDGWNKYYFVIVDNYDAAVEYSKYDLVWSTTENKFYEYINDTPTTGNVVTDTAYFSEVADPTSKIANVGTSSESGNLTYQVVNKVTSYLTSICFLKAAAKHAKETCGDDDCGCNSRLGKAFHKIRELFSNLAINETTGMYLEGEKNARLAEKYCDDCGCLTR